MESEIAQWQIGERSIREVSINATEFGSSRAMRSRLVDASTGNIRDGKPDSGTLEAGILKVDEPLNSFVVNNSEVSDRPGPMDLERKRVERERASNPRKREELPSLQPSLHQRIREIVWHIPWYAFKTQARLAQDSGVSPAAISRLIRGESQPSLAIALRVTLALSRRLGKPLDVGEVFSLDGTYPTPSVCTLTGCRNCLPPTAYESDDCMKAEFEGVKAGQWSLSGLTPKEVHEA